MNIYVSNLGFNVQDEDLKEFFTPYGEVTSAKIINDRESGRSRGFGFVEMSDDAAAQKAITELNDATVEGRTIKVMEAKPKEDRPARSNNGGGGGGYNNGNSYNRNRY
ncbi:MAG TPA: RNA-binding protein [Flavisolibacter sp.]|jgi:RNA recognition motif-containing protein|nr:RNA-binding protein [Flavisolibacter sp.]